ncbi:carboxypeptidase regulatory-like domain-containing protein [Candidatus Saganbacteria bacterium]|nr:carboxypeptidase regulatory-like domain-containing protein [Candidatus Saganbacteria bacterium]
MLDRREKPRYFIISLGAIFTALFFLPFFTGCGDDTGGIASIIVAPSAATIGVNQSIVFTVTGRTAAGLLVLISPTWSLTGGIGAIDAASGLFTAGDAAGSGTVSASYGGVIGNASVTVTENGWISGQISSTLGSISGIRVYLRQLATLDAFTSSSGNYEIANVPPGTYEVKTAATDIYLSSSQEVSVRRGQTRSGINFVLQIQPGVPIIPTTTNPF